MAVIITEARNLIDEADAVTDWESPVGGEAETVVTADPSPMELTGCLGLTISQEAGETVHTYSADFTSTIIYGWAQVIGAVDDLATGGLAIALYDDTNLVAYHVAGSDVAGFRHSVGPVGWQCIMLDTSQLPTTYYTELVGTHAALMVNIASITAVGYYFSVASKALGGAKNCFIDILRHGVDGIIITGGGVGTEGDFSEIAAADRTDTNLTAFGICHELGAGLFGLQGPLTFGDDGGTGSVDFLSTNEVIVFEDRGLGTSRYYTNVKGNGTGSTSFQLGNQIGATTAGKDGSSLICPIDVGAKFDASDTDVEYVLIYGSLIKGFNNGVLFSADATNGPNHEIFDTSFIGCGQIDPGKAQFKNNSISNTTSSGTGAVLLDGDGTSAWSDLTFTSGVSGHGVYITVSGTYTFDNIQMIGYGGNGTIDAAIYNNSGGLVTIDSTNGSSGLTYLNGVSASTSIVSSVIITLTGLVSSSEVRVYDAGTTTELDGIENSGTSFEFTLNNAVYPYVDVVIHHLDYKYYRVSNYEVPSTSTSLPIAQEKDRWYSNP